MALESCTAVIDMQELDKSNAHSDGRVGVMENKFVPVKTEEKADYLVSQVVANLSFEGMIVPDDERERLKKVALGIIPYDVYLKQLKENPEPS